MEENYDDTQATDYDNEDSEEYEPNDLNTQINELFRHIYNEEKEQIEKLKKKVWPQIENVQVDHYILQAIESSMNIVRDQLKQSIKDQLL